jgi:3-dehydroquinate synthase
MAHLMATNEKTSQIKFLDTFPIGKKAAAIAAPENSLLIFDQKLAQISREFSQWAQLYPHRYGVTSGEALKDLALFAGHASRLAQLASSLPPRTMTVVAAGGGSVGDFAGFFASIYKRGVNLIHVPSTWLAAIDSSHGGKTALNIGGTKNQLGTFFPASRVVLVQSLLFHQPSDRVTDAMGELGKIALIDGGEWTKRLARSRFSGEDLLWNFLKPAIQAKLKVVARDPFEKNGHRQVLNFGHTIGHVLEAAHGWSHGGSVAQGTFFAIEYSRERGLMTAGESQKILHLFESKLGLAPFKPEKIPARRFTELLSQDKKKSARDKVTFIFLKRIGRVERESVNVGEIVNEARRQGIVR